MGHARHPDHRTVSPRQHGTRRPRIGVTLLFVLALAGLLLLFGYRAQVPSEALFALPLLLCVAMHWFMHRGHRRGGPH